MSNRTLCNRLVGSVSVTVVGTSLVVNIPEANYDNCEKLCLAILQEIPTATVTRGMPVVITIGDGTVQYPIVTCNGLPVTQEYIGQNNVYPLMVLTTTTSAIFKVCGSICKVSTNLPSIPTAVTTPAEGG
jgi:hypothetical protein